MFGVLLLVCKVWRDEIDYVLGWVENVVVLFDFNCVSSHWWQVFGVRIVGKILFEKILWIVCWIGRFVW